MPTSHFIEPIPENVVWGYFDAAVPAVHEVESGDIVTLTSWPAGDGSRMPEDTSLVPQGYLDVLNEVEQGPGAHILTGPIAVKGAEPGDVLQVDILEHSLPMAWGWTAINPLAGTLPEMFDRRHVVISMIDGERKVARLPWGTEIPLDPFFGCIAVAPPPHWGRCPSPPPRKFGGNMDNKELKPGTTLYLPVFAKGALFTAGDGHAVQGDGEVCISALETALQGSFRLTVRKDIQLDHPFAETATHLISIGLNEDLDDAAAEAVREMVEHVCRRTSLSPEDAYVLCSLIGDLRISQVVDGVKGCHMMLAKDYL